MSSYMLNLVIIAFAVMLLNGHKSHIFNPIVNLGKLKLKQALKSMPIWPQNLCSFPHPILRIQNVASSHLRFQPALLLPCPPLCSRRDCLISIAVAQPCPWHPTGKSSIAFVGGPLQGVKTFVMNRHFHRTSVSFGAISTQYCFIPTSDSFIHSFTLDPNIIFPTLNLLLPFTNVLIEILCFKITQGTWTNLSEKGEFL